MLEHLPGSNVKLLVLASSASGLVQPLQEIHAQPANGGCYILHVYSRRIRGPMTKGANRSA
jgi:hypothetical protein